MAIFRTIKDNNYTVVHNGFILDEKLSLKAKGLLVYFLSRPDNWDFYTNEIASHCSNKEKSITSCIKELMSAGYIKRVRKQDESGRFKGGFEYHIYENPQNVDAKEQESEEIDCQNKDCNQPDSQKGDYNQPDRQKADRQKADRQNGCILNTDIKLNTDLKVNTNLNNHHKVNSKNKENTKACSNVNDDIYSFYEENNFGVTTKAVKEILDGYIDRYTKDMVKNALLAAIKRGIYKLAYVEAILENSKNYIKGGNASGSATGNNRKECKKLNEYDEKLQREGLILNLDDLL